jgi:hypothetical protein
MSTTTTHKLVSMPSRESSAMPSVTMAVPMIGKIRYFPQREISWPLRIDVISRPSISGVS